MWRVQCGQDDRVLGLTFKRRPMTAGFAALPIARGWRAMRYIRPSTRRMDCKADAAQTVIIAATRWMRAWCDCVVLITEWT